MLWIVVTVVLVGQVRGQNLASCANTLCSGTQVCRIIKRCWGKDCQVGTACIEPSDVTNASGAKCHFDTPLVHSQDGGIIREIQCGASSLGASCPVGTTCVEPAGVCCTGADKNMGVCPAKSSSSSFLSRGSCKTFCQHDQECTGFKRCCATGMGCNACMDPVPLSTCESHACGIDQHCMMAETACITYPCFASPTCIPNKAGQCPMLDKQASCTDQCKVDSHCSGDRKCCSAGGCNICVSPGSASTSSPSAVSTDPSLNFNDGFGGLGSSGMDQNSFDSVGGSSLGGSNLGGSSLGGSNLGDSSLGGGSLGGGSLGGGSLGGGSLGGGSLGTSFGVTTSSPTSGSFPDMGGFLGSSGGADAGGLGGLGSSSGSSTSGSTLGSTSSTGGSNPFGNMLSMMQNLRNGGTGGTGVSSMSTMLSKMRNAMNTMKTNALNGASGGLTNPFGGMLNNLNPGAPGSLGGGLNALGSLGGMNSLGSGTGGGGGGLSTLSNLGGLKNLGGLGSNSGGGGGGLDPVMSGNTLQTIGGGGGRGRGGLGNPFGGGLSPGLNPRMPVLGGRTLDSVSPPPRRRFKCDAMCMMVLMIPT